MEQKNKDNTIITVEGDGKIDLRLLQIDLFEGLGWHVTVYPIYHGGQVKIENFYSIKAGLYSLLIKYGDELVSEDLFYYTDDPIFERLTLSFFQDHERVFCHLSSLCAHHLNKLIVLDEVKDYIKQAIKKIEDGEQ